MTKVSVQEAVALDGHFATLCQEVDFYEAIFFQYVQIERGSSFILLIILIVKSL